MFFDLGGHDESNDTSRGTNSLNPPNWFDDTTKHWGDVVESKIDGLSTLKSAERFFYTNSAGGNHSGIVPTSIDNSYNVPVGSVLISPKAAGRISPQVGYVYTPRTSGIDSFGAVILHEMRHRWQLQQSWGIADGDSEQTLESKIGPNGAWIKDGNIYDRDADGLRDDWETSENNQPVLDPTSIPQNLWSQYAYWLNQHHDGNSFEPDAEFDADMEGARNWQVGSADDEDWANNGKQANQG